MADEGATARVSLATVAARAGVSVSTVSRIVNGETRRASPQTAARVLGVVEALGYRPDPIGRALRRRQSRIVAMLAPNLDNPAMAAIAASTEAALRRAGYVMILCDTHDRAELQDEYLAAMRSQLVQGYVLVSAVASPGLTGCLARGEAAVFVARRDPEGRAAYVGIDDRRAGADAADHLIARGVTRFAVLSPEQGSSSSAAREAGFLDHLAARGIAAFAVRRARAAGLSHLAVGYEAAAGLVARDDWPEGLLCVSDLMAYGVYRLAVEQGVAIPARCVVVGIDDNPLNSWVAPWLTSIHIPYDRFGDEVVAQLDAIWRGERARERLLAHHLVVRGAPRPSEPAGDPPRVDG